MAMFNISADYQHPHKTYISVLLPSYLSLCYLSMNWAVHSPQCSMLLLSLLSLSSLCSCSPPVVTWSVGCERFLSVLTFCIILGTASEGRPQSVTG